MCESSFRLHSLPAGGENRDTGEALVRLGFTFLSSLLVRSDYGSFAQTSTERWRNGISLALDQVRQTDRRARKINEAFLSFSDLSELTAIKKEDVLAALQNLNIIRYQQGSYVLSITKDLFDSYQDKRRLRVNSKSLFWTPKIATKPSNPFLNK